MVKCYVTRDELERLLRSGHIRMSSVEGEWVNISLNSRFNVVDMLNRLKLEGK